MPAKGTESRSFTIFDPLNTTVTTVPHCYAGKAVWFYSKATYQAQPIPPPSSVRASFPASAGPLGSSPVMGKQALPSVWVLWAC